MTEQNSQSGTRRQKRKRIVLSVVALVVLLAGAAAFLLLPRRVTDIVTVDGEGRWSEESAPTRRKIVWQTPEQVEGVAPREEDVPTSGAAEHSFIRPQLAEDGSALYFTLRKSDGEADIFRSKLVNGEWQAAVSVGELNTPADDIGPAISADGQRLYLYSDRAEGLGGFDLYVSKKTSDGWSKPRNLGPRINTSANEYAPAISPDGSKLIFSSNRNRRMQQRALEVSDDAPAEWTETLRAQQGLVQYDLYVARQADEEQWLAATPLEKLNLPNANEGTPFITDSGVFLYFTSDRPARAGESPNYDLYRARIDGERFVAVENLGTGVNTAANELDPALSPEGFRLFFSSDRVAGPNRIEQPHDEQLYVLYNSTAKEVFEESMWIESRLPGVVDFLAEHWWWFVLGLLAAALLAALIWYFRQVSLKRAPVPGFLLTALILHIALAGGLFFVGFGEEIIKTLKEKFSPEVAMDLGTTEEPEEPKPFEKVKELTALESVETTDEVRQVSESPSVPLTPEEYNALPALDPNKLPLSKFVVMPQKAPPAPMKTLELARRNLVDLEQTLPQSQIDIRPAEPDKSRATKPNPKLVDVDQSRQSAVPAPRDPSELSETRAEPLRVSREDIATKTLTPMPKKPSIQPDQVLARRTTDIPETFDSPRISVNDTPDNTPTKKARPQDAVAVADQTKETSSPNSLPEALVRREPIKLELKPQAGSPSNPRAEPVKPSPTKNRSPNTPFERTRPSVQEFADATTIQTDANSQAPTESTSDLIKTSGAELTVNRKAPVLTDSSDFARPSQIPQERIRPTGSAPAARQPDALASISNRPFKDNPLSRRDPVAVESLTEGIKIDSEPSSNAAPGSPKGLSKEAVAVDSARQDAGAPSVKPQTPLENIAHSFAGRPQADPSARKPQDRLAVVAPNSKTAPTPFSRFAPEDLVPQLEGVNISTSGAPDSQNLKQAGLHARAAAVGVVQSRESVISIAGLTTPTDEQARSLAVPRSEIDGTGPPAFEAVDQPKTGTSADPLSRAVASATAPASEIKTDPVAPLQGGQPSTSDTLPRNLAGVDIDVNRPVPGLISSPPGTASQIRGPFNPLNPRLIAERFGPVQTDVDAPVTKNVLPFGRRATQLATTMYAGDGKSIRRLLAGRQAGPKMELVKAFGGNEETLEAIRRGLAWFASHQFPDGHWSLHDFNKCCKGHKKCTGHGGEKADAAATGFALLGFLGDGQTHVSGQHRAAVRRGIDWLVAGQKASGELNPTNVGNARMYSHAIATIAMCEAFSMTQDKKLREPTQRAIDFIVKAQHKASGGWRYQPNQSADTSVVGWQVMALKSGEIAGLDVPPETFSLVTKWLNQVEAQGKNRGQFGYTGRGPNLAMTAEGLLCRRYLGAQITDPSLRAGADHLLKNLPQKGRETSYYWYYATQLMFHLSPDYWEVWNNAQRDMLTQSQHKDGPLAGTWDPKDQWENRGGRIYTTSLRVMMLEVYFRHQPLYKLFEE